VLRLQPPDLAEQIDSPDLRPTGYDPSRALRINVHQENNGIWVFEVFGVDPANFLGLKRCFR